MSALLRDRDPALPLTRACAALGAVRGTVHRHLRPRHGPAPAPRPRGSARALTPVERHTVLEHLHSERFVDQPPREVYGTLLVEGVYHCSVRSMYRLLAAHGEARERREQRAPTRHPVPQLLATAPNQVWTWDISKLPTTALGVFLNLYLILDLFSRYIVGWMVAQRENTALAQQLIARSVERLGIDRGQLTLHNDRGAPMTARSFDALLALLGIEPSRSRPRGSNDNPFSESGFKTLKFQPDYPGRFVGSEHARAFVRRFVPWYNEQHRHDGLHGFTPAEVFSGRHRELAAQRHAVRLDAYAPTPERWIQGPPKLVLPPDVVTINPAPPLTSDSLAPLPNEVVPAESIAIARAPSRSIAT